MDMILILGLALFAFAALVVWLMLDIDIADMVATVGAPIAGVFLIYWYGTPLAWTGALLLFLIGGFGLYYLLKRRSRAPERDS
jgi:lysozyme family protein